MPPFDQRANEVLPDKAGGASHQYAILLGHERPTQIATSPGSERELSAKLRSTRLDAAELGIVLNEAMANRAKEFAQEYAERESGAINQVTKLFASRGRTSIGSPPSAAAVGSH